VVGLWCGWWSRSGTESGFRSVGDTGRDIIKQMTKSLIKRLIRVFLLCFAKDNYRSVYIIIMIINVGIKMHFDFVGADGPNRRTVKRMCVNECIVVVVVQSIFYLRIK
jgi:hypothetical protein